MIDSHCHLTASAFDKDRDAVIASAFQNDISQIITIAETLDDAMQAADLAAQYDQIFATAGIHPHKASEWDQKSADALISLLKRNRVVAVGEIGLDFHYDFSPRDVQKNVFRQQLEIARDIDLPAVVHSRECIDVTWNIIEEAQPQNLVLHCCTEAFEDVERFLDAGYLLSFTGIATFPASKVIRDTIRKTPLNQIMIETDAPYLSPVPYRGRRNEPSYVIEVARCIASEKKVDLEKSMKQTSENAQRFFGI